MMQTCEDFHEKLQHQTDLTYCLASRNGTSVTDYHDSIQQEICLLLHIGNYEKAISKVRRNKLYKLGICAFSKFQNLFDTIENLDEQKKLFVTRKQLFEGYQDFMDSSIDSESGDFEFYVDRDRENANIIVDGNCDKGFRNGKFYVTDLVSGLKLAQNKGGFIFLEDGDYSTETFFDVKSKSPDQAITIVGSSTSDCSIHGTIKIQAENAVHFRRVKLEVGSSPECTDAIFITQGSVTFTECLMEATVNTLFYVLQGSQLSMDLCIVDGLESCQRCVSVSGTGAVLSLSSSWVRDMFSVVTITKEDAVTNLTLNIEGCDIDGVQTAVTATKAGVTSMSLARNSFNMNLYFDEEPSHILSLSSFSDYEDSAQADNYIVKAQDNIIKFQHIDGKAFHVDGVASVRIINTRIETEDDIDRKLAICEAVAATNIRTLELDRVQVYGFRVGVSVIDTREVIIRKALIEKCSIGIYSPKHQERVGSLITLEDCEFKSMFYGFLIANRKVKIKMTSVKFLDVPKPLLLNKASVDSLLEEDCSYLLTQDFTSAKEFRLLEEEMNLHLATQENIALMAAYDRDEVQMVFRYDSLGYSNG